MQLQNVPALNIDAILFPRNDMHVRAQNERRVVFALLEMLVAKGFTILSVWDGECMEKMQNPAAQVTDAMECVFNLDESSVWVQKPGFKPHHIFLVLGNAEDGSEVVADYSYSDNDPDEFDALMNAFEPENFV